MFVRRLLGAVAAAILIGPAFAEDAILAVNEGVTYQEGGGVHERYKLLVELLSKELKRPVKVVNVDKYAVLEQGLAEEKYDMAFVHPAHIGLRAVKAGRYQGLCTAKGYIDYRARILVLKDSPFKSMQDLRGRKVGVPSMESITTVMFVASLRQMNFTEPEKQFTATRYQDAVPFMIEKGFVEAGVTGSAAVENEWKRKGGRVLGETKPVPIKQFLVSKKVSDADRGKIQALMLGLADNEAGRAALAKIGMSGFVPWDAGAMNEAANRLGI
jgi:phosphonate transport system substrate-binding protein